MNTWALSVKWAEVAAGTYRAELLMGPAYANKRQALLEALHGRKIPKSQCGVTRLIDDLVTAYGVNREQCFAGIYADLANHIQREVLQAQRL